MERVPCEPNPECKFYKNDSCYRNRHHIWYPRNQYQTPLEKRFRNHPDNIQIMCRMAHELIHLTQEPPEKPLPEVMRLFLDGGEHGQQAS